MRYSCEHAEKNRWFETARREGRWELDARIDDTWSSEIYVREPTTGELLECSILPCEKLSADKPLAEVRYIQEYLKRSKELPDKMVAKIEFRRKIEDIVGNAQEEKKQQPAPSSKRAKIKNIPKKRKDEIEKKKSSTKTKSTEEARGYSSNVIQLLRTGRADDE